MSALLLTVAESVGVVASTVGVAGAAGEATVDEFAGDRPDCSHAACTGAPAGLSCVQADSMAINNDAGNTTDTTMSREIFREICTVNPR